MSLSKQEDEKLLSKIIKSIDNGENVILHGPGGTGKTYILRTISTEVCKNKVIFCTATTGIAAMNLSIPECNISATTLHSWAGVGLAQETEEKLLEKVRKGIARKRWEKVDLLIIDEIGMLGSVFIDKLDYIGREIRGINKPFGGIQLLLSGDFLQLPPVKDGWLFDSEVWSQLDIHPFIFDVPKRYDDVQYFELLLRMRQGTPSEGDIKKMRARVRSYKKLIKILEEKKDNVNIIKPTILSSKKIDVEYENEKELALLKGEEVCYIAIDTFKPYKSSARSDYYMRSLEDTIPKTITLKVGAQVMLKKNISVKDGLVNGSRGVVLEINSTSTKVRFINGMKIDIPVDVWELKDKDGKATRTQIPLILAWSLTIHKVQGCTLDYAICNLGGSIFSPGQAYVALSRVRNIKGLFLSCFLESSIIVSKKALKFSKSLELLSKELENKTIENEDSDDSEDFSAMLGDL